MSDKTVTETIHLKQRAAITSFRGIEMSPEMKMAHALHQLTQILERKADQLLQKKLNMTFMQVMILIMTESCPVVTQRHVADAMRVTPGAISRQVDSLHRAGYINRTVNTDNRREQNLTLTKAGHTIVAKGYEILDETVKSTCAGMEASEIDRVTVLIQKIIKNSPLE